MKRPRDRERRLARQLAIVADDSRPWPRRKTAARYAACLAEKLGLIDRPNGCEWCRQRRPLERHHPDHMEPLAVNWLCRDCHEIADSADMSAVTRDSGRTPANIAPP